MASTSKSMQRQPARWKLGKHCYICVRRCAGVALGVLFAFALAGALIDLGFCDAAHLQRAVQLLSQGDLAGADQEARQALQDPATQPQAWGILGTILLQQGRISEGAKDLEKAIALNPALVGARINLGEAYRRLGQPVKAEKAFRAAINHDPANFSARLDYAELQNSLHQYREALVTAQPAFSQFHRSSAGLVVLAEAYAATRRNRELGALFSDWTDLSSQPTSVEAVRFARCLSQAGLNAQARRELAKAQDASQPDFNLAYEAANIDRLMGKLQDAEQDYTLALRLKPECAACEVGLAAVAEQQNNSEKALACLIKARQMDPNNPEVQFEFGKICLVRDLVDDAVPALKKALAIQPQNASYQYVMASAYVARQKYAQAAELLNRLLTKHAQDPELNYAAGAVAYLQADYPRAQTLLNKSIALQPHQLAAYYYLALLYEKERQDDRALRILRQLVRQHPDHAPSYVTMGKILLREKQYNEAHAALDKAIELDPESADAHYQMAMLLGRMGNMPDSRRQSDIARKLQAEARAKTGMNLRLVLPNQPNGSPLD